MTIERIISGGQTGADRGGLDAAIALGIPHGGYCPKGRVAEDGAVPAKYNLVETTVDGYVVRTRMNVEAADATVIFMRRMTPGSRSTGRYCREAGKPYINIVVYPEYLIIDEAVDRLRNWLRRLRVSTLNVAGSRESRAPGIHDMVRRILTEALS